jgi:hypothetical protein
MCVIIVAGKLFKIVQKGLEIEIREGEVLNFII